MSTIEEDLDEISMCVQFWESTLFSRAHGISQCVVDIRLKLKVLAEENDALLRDLEHLVTEERT